jgi:hypothetical protein
MKISRVLHYVPSSFSYKKRSVRVSITKDIVTLPNFIIFYRYPQLNIYINVHISEYALNLFRPIFMKLYSSIQYRFT